MSGLSFARKYIKPVRRLIIWLEGFNSRWRAVNDSADHFPGPFSPQGLNLNIMSFNIRRGTRRDGRNHWLFRRPLVREVLHRHRPDVLGLQEALDFQIAEIRSILPGYEMVGEGNLGGSRGLHTAVFYDANRFALVEAGTFWLSATPAVPRSRGWGNIIPRTCTWVRLIEKSSRQAFYFYNVHLDHLSQRARKKSVLLLTRKIQARRFLDPFVLVGDFNAEEENPSIRFLEGRGRLKITEGGRVPNPFPLMDVFRNGDPDYRREVTYHGYRRYLFRFKFDYIFVPPSSQVHEAKVIHLQRRKRFPSDHFPLFSRIVLPLG
ncbi:MAG: endonuclease/exonuclease/phosphatase family protein [Syntrophaceae bacterium]|nr:endonuclease/exonuclease/phosphatase family protein [Syntrophaceae bacterium]